MAVRQGLFFFFIQLFFSLSLLQAQKVKGVVFDFDTKEAIAFANVYFNSSTHGTTTDQNGHFILETNNYEGQGIVISCVGYDSWILADYESDMLYRIYLKPSSWLLKEIVISPNDLPREKKEKIFKKYFLGSTRNARQCQIQNMEDVILVYQKESKTLEAYCYEPLIIHNQALGYKIKYFLDSFNVDRNYFFYQGNYLFEEDTLLQGRSREKVIIKRKKAYYGSRMHFFRALWHGEEGNLHFKVQSLDTSVLVIDSLVTEEIDKLKYLKALDKFKIYYKSFVSLVEFKDAKCVPFNRSGFFDSENLYWRGHMARQRVGDLLPFEYWPYQSNSDHQQPWPLHIIDNAHSGADGVRVQDINGDGLPDITTGWEEAGLTKIYLHPGINHVRGKWPTAIVGNTPSVEDAVFMDLDEDGFFDVVSSTEGKSKKVFISWSPSNPTALLDSASWETQILSASDGLAQWMYAIPLQVDGKNGIDIVVGSKGKNANIGWFRSPSNPRNVNDWKWYPISSCGWIMSLFTRDMDNDGDMDIVTSDRRGADRGVRWLENPGVGPQQFYEWKNHEMGAQDREVMFMDLADIDHDGLEDAIVSEYTNQKIVIMKRKDESGRTWEMVESDLPEYSGRAKSVRIGDLDNNGSLDMVHASETQGIGGKHGIIQTPVSSSLLELEWKSVTGLIGYKFDRIELLDLDGDGDLDILTCEENYGDESEGLGVIWYENPY